MNGDESSISLLTDSNCLNPDLSHLLITKRKLIRSFKMIKFQKNNNGKLLE